MVNTYFQMVAPRLPATVGGRGAIMPILPGPSPASIKRFARLSRQ
jgi:hypothetical protein